MNKVILIGNLTRDPELNFAANSGTAICKFSLAVTRPFKKEEADFINCIAFGKTGETIAQYLTRGSKLALSGRIQTGSYDAKDGTKRYTTDIIVETFEFVGSNNGGNRSMNAYNNVNNSSNSNSEISAPGNDPFGAMTFENDMTPVDDGDMPF